MLPYGVNIPMLPYGVPSDIGKTNKRIPKKKVKKTRLPLAFKKSSSGTLPKCSTVGTSNK